MIGSQTAESPVNCRSATSSFARNLTAIAVTAWITLGLGAMPWPGGETEVFKSNRRRLERMTPEQRHVVWQKYQEFLALSPVEQDRLRRLKVDLRSLPLDKAARYRAMMDRYLEWVRTLPLYQQHMLEDAAGKGSNELYARFREVQSRKESEDRARAYWFTPDAAPGIRKAVPRILAKLTPEEIEVLDQAPPVDRIEKLLAAANRHEIEPPQGGAGRPFGMGPPLPPPDPEKLREFLQNLPREKLEELGDLGFMKRVRERQILELYYRLHPEERQRRMESGREPPRPLDRGRPGNNAPSDRADPPNRGDTSKGSGRVGIPSTKN